MRNNANTHVLNNFIKCPGNAVTASRDKKWISARVFPLIAGMLFFSAEKLLAQQQYIPFNNTTNGMPNADAVGGNKATVLFGNSDKSVDLNEWLYFKVYAPGGTSTTFDWYTNPSAWMTDKDFHFSNLNLELYNKNYVEFGAKITKELNAGKIGYQLFSDGLDIIGAGTTNTNRRIVFYNEGGAKFWGGAEFTGNVQLPQSNYIQFGGTNNFGKIAFNGSAGGLEITAPSTEVGKRKITLWAQDGVDFQGGAYFNGNVIGSNLLLKNPSSAVSFKNGISADILSRYRLLVETGILSEDYAIAPKANWSDYVFNKEYRRRSLQEVETFINSNGHLPGIPSAKEIADKGYDFHTINTKFLEKIEELTLYVIDQQKEIEMLKQESARYRQLSEKVEQLLSATGSKK